MSEYTDKPTLHFKYRRPFSGITNKVKISPNVFTHFSTCKVKALKKIINTQ